MSNYVDQNVQFGSTQHVYEEQSHFIPAGQSLNVYFPHDYFRVIDMTGGNLAVRFGQNGNVTKHSGAGLGKSHTMVLDQVQLYNIGATDMTITIAMGIGDISDSRLNVSGEVQVKNITGGVLKTDDDETQAKIDSLIAKLQDKDALRSPINVIGGSFANAASNADTLVTPAANTNGLIIRTANIFTVNLAATLYADTAAPANATDKTKRIIMIAYNSPISLQHALYVPAGNGVYFTLNGALTVNYGASITYDLL